MQAFQEYWNNYNAPPPSRTLDNPLFETNSAKIALVMGIERAQRTENKGDLERAKTLRDAIFMGLNPASQARLNYIIDSTTSSASKPLSRSSAWSRRDKLRYFTDNGVELTEDGVEELVEYIRLLDSRIKNASTHASDLFTSDNAVVDKNTTASNLDPTTLAPMSDYRGALNLAKGESVWAGATPAINLGTNEIISSAGLSSTVGPGIAASAGVSTVFVGFMMYAVAYMLGKSESDRTSEILLAQRKVASKGFEGDALISVEDDYNKRLEKAEFAASDARDVSFNAWTAWQLTYAAGIGIFTWAAHTVTPPALIVTSFCVGYAAAQAQDLGLENRFWQDKLYERLEPALKLSFKRQIELELAIQGISEPNNIPSIEEKHKYQRAYSKCMARRRNEGVVYLHESVACDDYEKESDKPSLVPDATKELMEKYKVKSRVQNTGEITGDDDREAASDSDLIGVSASRSTDAIGLSDEAVIKEKMRSNWRLRYYQVQRFGVRSLFKEKYNTDEAKNNLVDLFYLEEMRAAKVNTLKAREKSSDHPINYDQERIEANLKKDTGIASEHAVFQEKKNALWWPSFFSAFAFSMMLANFIPMPGLNTGSAIATTAVDVLGHSVMDAGVVGAGTMAAGFFGKKAATVAKKANAEEEEQRDSQSNGGAAPDSLGN
jgi:hypothetical protein